MAEEVIEDFRSSLADLKQNSKPVISMITMLADDNRQYADEIVKVIEAHLHRTVPAYKLPCLYLIDSIMKNVHSAKGGDAGAGGEYIQLFSKNIVFCFLSTFEKVDERTRQSMFKLRQTWTDLFPNKLLYSLDFGVSRIDPAWPITATPEKTTSGPNIHVNPKFLLKQQQQQQQSGEETTGSNVPGVEQVSSDKKSTSGVKLNKAVPKVVSDIKQSSQKKSSGTPPPAAVDDESEETLRMKLEKEKLAAEAIVFQDLLLQQQQKQQELLLLQQQVLENELSQARAKLEEQAKLLQKQQQKNQVQQVQQQQTTVGGGVKAQVKISAAIAPSSRDPRTKARALNTAVELTTQPLGSTIQQTAVVLPTCSSKPSTTSTDSSVVTQSSSLPAPLDMSSSRAAAAANIWERMQDLTGGQQDASNSRMTQSSRVQGSETTGDGTRQNSEIHDTGQSSLQTHADSRIAPANGSTDNSCPMETSQGQLHRSSTSDGSSFPRLSVDSTTDWADGNRADESDQFRAADNWTIRRGHDPRLNRRGGRGLPSPRTSLVTSKQQRDGLSKSSPEDKSGFGRKSLVRGSNFKIPRLGRDRGRGPMERRSLLRSPVDDRPVPPIKRMKTRRNEEEDEEGRQSGDMSGDLMNLFDKGDQDYRSSSQSRQQLPDSSFAVSSSTGWANFKAGRPDSLPPDRPNELQGRVSGSPRGKRALLPTPPSQRVEDRPSLLGESPSTSTGASLLREVTPKVASVGGSVRGEPVRTVTGGTPMLSEAQRVITSSNSLMGEAQMSATPSSSSASMELQLQDQMLHLQRMRAELEDKKRELYTQSVALGDSQGSRTTDGRFHGNRAPPPLQPPPLPPRFPRSGTSLLPTPSAAVAPMTSPSLRVSAPIPFRRQSSTTNEFWEAPPVPWYDNSLYYVPEHDARWLLRAAVSQTGDSEAYSIVIDGRQYEMTLNNRPRQIRLGETSQIEVRLDPGSRQLWIDNQARYRLGEEPKETFFNGRSHTVWAHGPVRKVWIDRQQFEINVDAPAEKINIGGREHKIRIDGGRNWIIVDGFDICPFGTVELQKVTLAFIVHTIQFKAPLKQILIDGSLCDLDLSGKYPVVVVQGAQRGIRFDGTDREIHIDDVPFVVPMDKAIKWRQEVTTPSGVQTSSKPRLLAFGGPGYEVIIDDQWYEVKFGGNAKFVKVGGRMHKVELRGEAPEVKILGEMVAATDLGRVLRGQPPSDDNQRRDQPRMIGPRPEQMMGPPVPPRPPLGHMVGEFDQFRPQRHHGPSQDPSHRPPSQLSHNMQHIPFGRQEFGGPRLPGWDPSQQGGPPNQAFGAQQHPHMQQQPFMLPPPAQQPNQPQLPNLQQQQQPVGTETAVSQASDVKTVDVNVLLNQLMAAGLIQAAAAGLKPATTATTEQAVASDSKTAVADVVTTATSKATETPPTPTVSAGVIDTLDAASACVGSLIVDGVITEETRKAMQLEEDLLPPVPDMTTFVPAELRRRHLGAIKSLRIGLQCSTCGLRFRKQAVESAAYSAHLDWHFRANRRAKERERSGHSRGWHYEDVDWIQYEELGETEEADGLNDDESSVLPMTSDGDGSVAAGSADVDDRPTALGDEEADACAQCKEAFEQFWDEEAEAWRLKDAVRFRGDASKTYHKICFEDAKNSGGIRGLLDGEDGEEGVREEGEDSNANAADEARARPESWAEMKAEIVLEEQAHVVSETMSETEEMSDASSDDSERVDTLIHVKSEPTIKYHVSDDASSDHNDAAMDEDVKSELVDSSDIKLESTTSDDTNCARDIETECAEDVDTESSEQPDSLPIDVAASGNTECASETVGDSCGDSSAEDDEAADEMVDATVDTHGANASRDSLTPECQTRDKEEMTPEVVRAMEEEDDVVSLVQDAVSLDDVTLDALDSLQPSHNTTSDETSVELQRREERERRNSSSSVSQSETDESSCV